MPDETDAELVAEVRRGSRKAAGLLAERYLRACRAVALSIVGDEAGAEDVCQDAFVAAIERIDDCREPDRFGFWLLQIVRNRARNLLRDERPERWVALDQEELLSKAPSPEAEAEMTDMRDRLLLALGQLPEDRREVVLLHDLEGWTHREIAERMGLPAGTVRSHLHYARMRLRKLLGERRSESDE